MSEFIQTAQSDLWHVGLVFSLVKNFVSCHCDLLVSKSKLTLRAITTSQISVSIVLLMDWILQNFSGRLTRAIDNYLLICITVIVTSES